jgi:hypothetical protein
MPNMVEVIRNKLRTFFLESHSLSERLLYLLIAAAYGLRAWQVFQYNPMQHLWSDPLRHWTHAGEILQTGPMAFFDPIGYQLWLSIVQRITHGDPLTMGFYVVALSWVTPWVWYRAFRSLSIGRSLRLVGWAVLAWLPSWVAIYSYFMTETLFLPMLGWSIWATARAERKQTAQAFGVAVLVWTLTALVRGIAAPMAAAALLPVWLRQSGKLQKALVGVLIAGFLLGPIGYRNYQNVGLWSPFGNAWLNRIYAVSGKKAIQMKLVKNGAFWIYGYGSPSIDEKLFSSVSDWTSRREGQIDIAIDLTQGETGWAQAYRRHALQRTGWLYWENILYLFFGPSWPDNDPAQSIANLQTASRWMWAPLSLGAVLWSVKDWRGCRARPSIWILMAVWFCFQGLTLLTVNEGRYRKPFEGLLIAQLLLLADSSRKGMGKND